MNSPISAPLSFCPGESVIADDERRGLLRATRLDDPDNPAQHDTRLCQLCDWSREGAAGLDLNSMGFAAIDLAGLHPLQSVLQGVRAAGEITEADARQLRRGLTGRVFPLASGGCLRFLFVAPEGLIMRKVGPNGLQPDPDVRMGAMNGHSAAQVVHGDQDVRGTPLKQMMRGFAPWIFRHQTPDGDNRWSPLRLVNLWIPLDQITQPLALMDRRTLDKGQHQLRYALPTEAFLDREEETRVNDIWRFLHHPDQRWYCSSDMGSDQAYVFDTLGTPHGATILPGEEHAERCYLACREAGALLSAGEFGDAADVARRCAGTVPDQCTPALRRAVAALQAQLAAVADGAVCSDSAVREWVQQSDEVLDRLVRKSIEMRVVALQLPDVWPLNRSRR